MGLGGYMELNSFLGIGVPYASWGINAVNDVYVLTNFWFVWMPFNPADRS